MYLIVKCKVTNVFISYLILLFSTFKQTDKQFKQTDKQFKQTHKQFKQTDGFLYRQVNTEIIKTKFMKKKIWGLKLDLTE